MTVLWKRKGLEESVESLTSQIRIVTGESMIYDVTDWDLFMNGRTECAHLVTV